MASTKKEIYLLIILLLVFAILLIISIINLNRGLPVFGLGIGYQIENYLIIVLSFFSVIRVFGAIIKH